MPPRLMLITRAPFSTAQRIARASASTGIVRDFVTTFATRSSAEGASPAMPIPLPTPAAISPATNVPWPRVSVAGPPTKLFEPMILPASSGCAVSTPESITATGICSSAGSVTHGS